MLPKTAIKVKAAYCRHNHYQGWELVNALQLKAKETGGRVPVPPALLVRYPQLREIADAPAELW